MRNSIFRQNDVRNHWLSDLSLTGKYHAMVILAVSCQYDPMWTFLHCRCLLICNYCTQYQDTNLMGFMEKSHVYCSHNDHNTNQVHQNKLTLYRWLPFLNGVTIKLVIVHSDDELLLLYGSITRIFISPMQNHLVKNCFHYKLKC